MIRPATPDDCIVIQTLAHQIWPEVYASILSPAQLSYMLDMFYALEALQRQMAAGQQFLILEDNHVAQGFAAYQLDYTPGVTQLHKLYVRTAQQHKGWGSALLEAIEQRAIQSGQHTLRLNVNRFNNAQFFYQKKGFQTVETIDIPIGEGYLMEDFVMEKKLL
ncbi:GNAT family N-acetyltransferase [Flavobacterium sp.]|uniref:GNAT family N-acetyltransferase n=1 Tax=Flavobacterium sp. TaxID=239 RepID=UPI00260F05B6|nr:GNAT family N-acetyltransferase [Flavobacterium sp.]